MALSTIESVDQWVRETSLPPSPSPSPSECTSGVVPEDAAILLALYDGCLSLASSFIPHVEKCATSVGNLPGYFADDVASLYIWGEALRKSDLKCFYEESVDLRNTSLKILKSLGNVLTDLGLSQQSIH
jgi:hypothetical protein